LVNAKQISADIREATALSVMSLTGAAVAVAAIVSVILVFLFADAEERRDVAGWEDRLSIVADTRAGAVDVWLEDQYRELGALAENAALQLYMTELSRAAPGAPRLTEELAETGYLRNLLTVVADRAGYIGDGARPDIEANVDRVAVSGIALVDATGAVVAATRGMPPLDAAVHRSLLAPPDGGRGFLDIRRTPSGVPVIGFSLPVHGVQADGAARALGRVVGIRRIEPALYATLAQPGFAWSTAEILLVRPAGSQVDYLSPRRGGRAALTGAADAADAGLVAAIAAHGESRFGLATDYAGAEVLYAARRIAGAPWALAVKIDRAEAMGPSDARRATLIAALLAAIALVVVGLLALWRHGTSVRAAEAASRFRDLAQRYEAQSKFLRLVADSQPSPMFIVDRDGRYRFANRAAAQEAETAFPDMIGKSISSVLGPAAARRYEEANGSVIRSGAMVSNVHRSGSNGDLRVIQAEHIPVAEGPDFENGVLVVEQDITAAVREREHRETALRHLVRTLLTIVDSRDPYAANHSVQVGVVARAIAEEMALDAELVEAAEMAGSLMNVGKLLVPADLLTRPGSLGDDERRQVRDGIDAGTRLLADVPFVGPVFETLNQMNERWDGRGHPLGLKGADIVVTARVVAVANAFVAMLNPRAWRPGASFDSAIEMLLESAGREFDRAVVAALINRLENKGGRHDWATLGRAEAAH
jgi:PAS domain-containing protein